MSVRDNRSAQRLNSAAGIEIGPGAAEVLAVPGPGVVLSRHRAGAWLRLPGGICGLASPACAPAGPLWCRARCGAEHLEPGVPAVVTPARLEVGRLTLRLAGPAVAAWRGALPHHHLVEAAPARRLAVAALATARPSAVLEAPLAGAARRAAAAVANGDLQAAAEELGGLGPGLTPAGDDVLAGLLLAARARFGPVVEPALLAVATSVATTDLSGAFLRWAARGQHVAPAHDLLAAAARGDGPGAAAAVARLGRFGASSGTEVSCGLRLGLSQLPPVPKVVFAGFMSFWGGMSEEVANS